MKEARTLAHGLDGSWVEPDWPPIGWHEAAAVLREFAGSPEPSAILSHSPRPFSAASVVSLSGGGTLFIKRHHGSVRTAEGLREEHRFLAHLGQRGAPVVHVLSNCRGETAIEREGWCYEVHEVPAGCDLYVDALSWTPFKSTHHSRAMGVMMARLHTAAEGFDAPPRKARPLVASFSIFSAVDAERALQAYFIAHRELAEDALVRACARESLAVLAPFHAQLKPLLPMLAPLWTHNDLHPSNLLWSSPTSSADAVAVIDFGLADCTTAVYDIAHAIERSIVGWLDLNPLDAAEDRLPLHLDQLVALLDGYQSERLLSMAELEALAPMTALCHAEFALSEAEYFCRILHDREKTRLAVADYLLGHACWYRGKGGARLLAAINAWAARQQSVTVEREIHP